MFRFFMWFRFLVLGCGRRSEITRRRRPFPIPSRNFAAHCKEGLEPVLRNRAGRRCGRVEEEPVPMALSWVLRRQCDGACRIGEAPSLFGVTHRTCTMPGGMRRHLRHVLFSYSDVG